MDIEEVRKEYERLRDILRKDWIHKACIQLAKEGKENLERARKEK